MRRVASARQGGLIALVVTALGVLPLSGDAALSAPGCPDPTSPEMAPSLTDLHQALGDVMGSPLKCPLVDADGNTIQEMTTGLAVYRPSGMSVFVSGEHHWALSRLGLETWTGNWHNGLYPPVTPSPTEQDQSEPDHPPLATVEAMTLVQVRQDASNTVVVENFHGTMLTVETAGACPDVVAALGDSVFMRSGGPQTDLILVRQHETCAVAQMHASAGN